MSARRTLTLRVLVVLALATITPTLIVGALAIRRARADLEREVVRGNLALIRALGAHVDGTMQDARRALDLSAAAWADQRTTNAADTEFERRTTERLLRRLRREVPLFATLSIVGVDGDVLYGDPVAPDVGTGAHTFGGYVGDVVFVDGRPRVRVVAQARSRTGELVGVFVAQLDLQFVASALGQARVGTGARLLVVDGDGIPVAKSDGTVIGATSLRGSNPAVDRALASATEGNLESGGVVAVYRNLSSYQSLRGIRWAIIMEQPTSEAYALARKTQRDTIIAGFAVLAVFLLIGFVLASRITRPLRQLARRADAIAGEDHSSEPPPEAPIDAPGEIGALAQRFEEMAKRIGEREQLRAALARGDRLASVGTMAASVAHEVNNPLTTVLGYAKLLLEGKEEDHPDRAGLELIAEESARMKTIVGNMLDYSRSEKTPHPAMLVSDVNGVIEKTATLLVPQIRQRKIAVELDLGKPLPSVAADHHALQQVFVNLTQNAADAMMPDGGVVTISSRLAAGEIAVEVCFADDGPGIPEADRKRIFDPFFTTKEAGSGTGLGLAVVKHLVTSFGGTVGVEDGPDGRGALFRVMIPIVE
jgi:signal transduction histidine kinase